jgi:hypothetical protein
MIQQEGLHVGGGDPRRKKNNRGGKPMKVRKWYMLLTLVFVSVALIACSDDDPDDPGCTDCGSVNPSAEPFSSPIPTEWTKVDWAEYYPDFTYKDLSPSCLHCPMDDCESQFYFFAKGGTTDNLLVYFEGGGACWKTLNCIYQSTTNRQVKARVDPLGNRDGIADLDNPDNPFRDWNIVYIPYCTGDVHSGANDYDYPDDLGFHLLPDFNHWTIRHRGKVNFRVVLKWMQDTFSGEPDKLFVTGSSAGSYGAIVNFPDIRDTYPSSTAYCLPDAGNGILPDNDALFADLAQEQWDIQLPWQVEGFAEGTNDFTDFSIGEIMATIANHYPDVIIAPYSAAWDHNQIFFYWAMLGLDYSLVLTGVDYWEEVDDTAVDWNEGLYDVIDDALDNGTEGNIRYYISPGCNHTIMGSPKFYEEVTGGYTVAGWITQMLGTGLAGLPNVECTDCDTKPDYVTIQDSCD